MLVRTLFLLVVFVPSALAAEPPKAVAPLVLDRIAVEALKDIHDRGTDLYNDGDPASAYKLYEGALRTVAPFLAHRPKTQTVIADGLTAAAKLKGVKEQAFRLHEVIEEVRGELKADIKKADGETKKSVAGKDGPKIPDWVFREPWW